ncbi:MAG TPA: PilN domain-containing protein [Kofleriaceae bacterium]|jgi:Tfp pilus assembly protein PilN|nr:PilN domain-containing protein [Kofleriaceae bacterium]
MIKINLLPQRRPKRQAEPGQAEVLIGVGALAAAAALVFLVVHRPLTADRDAIRAESQELQQQNGKRRNSEAIKNLPKLKEVVAAEEQRTQAIERVAGAIVMPDNVLQELGDLLTPGRMPTMSKEMADRVSEAKGDANRQFALDWDPKHVWITNFTLKGELFTLEGGAQSESDIPQLAKRMQASVYFDDVTSPSSQKFDDKLGGLTYYKFTISGKVVY